MRNPTGNLHLSPPPTSPVRSSHHCQVKIMKPPLTATAAFNLIRTPRRRQPGSGDTT